MLLIGRRRRNLFADIPDQLIGIDHAILVLIGRTLQSLDDEVTEDAVTAACSRGSRARRSGGWSAWRTGVRESLAPP